MESNWDLMQHLIELNGGRSDDPNQRDVIQIDWIGGRRWRRGGGRILLIDLIINRLNGCCLCWSCLNVLSEDISGCGCGADAAADEKPAVWK